MATPLMRYGKKITPRQRFRKRVEKLMDRREVERERDLHERRAEVVEADAKDPEDLRLLNTST